MNLDLQGKIAFVTAGTQGLGLASALKLAEAGCNVAICGRGADHLHNACKEIELLGVKAFGVQADLVKPKQSADLVPQVIKHFGKLDILVVNSGHIPYGGIEDFTDAQWYDAFELLLMSAIRISRDAVSQMRKIGGGDIVFITSATAAEPSPTLLLSTVMRLGVTGLAKTLANSYAKDNIRVNIVAPGYFDTGRIRKRLDTMVSEKAISRNDAARSIAGEVPIGRIGNAEELGELVAFIASRKTGFMTGSTVTVDGGRSRSIL